MMVNMRQDLLKGWHLNVGAPDSVLRDAAAALGHALPADYVEFMREHDGGEGLIGSNYLIMWKGEELHPFNAEYEVSQYAPGLILFGSSGGGEGYGFDTRDGSLRVVRLPFVGMGWEYSKPVANNFRDALEVLARS